MMLVQFSPTTDPNHIDLHIKVSADRANAQYALKWIRNHSARFELVRATSEQHDTFIQHLLTIDPQASVRTARANYAGLEDFQRQYEASL